MEKYLETLKKLCERNGISLKDEHLEKFDIYLKVLLKWNRVYNLTSVRKKEDIVIKHFFDSLTLIKLFETAKINITGKQIADFGSGAGFPGVPLKIYFEDTIDLFLIEAVQKKCIFLEMLGRELDIKYKVLCERAEKIDLRFDVVVSRATGETFEVLKIGKNLLKKDGYLVIMKAKKIEEELKPFTVSLRFIGYGERKFIVIRKN